MHKIGGLYLRAAPLASYTNCVKIDYGLDAFVSRLSP